uniref:Peptidase A1 domain-containing protein n=1 Tax=Daucus carota subsp. sativus TaxID=79200 RepID=A0A161ZS97_DAUCS
MENEESPQLNKVVIITLPPPDNPSFGKTVSIFSYTDGPSQQQLNQVQENQDEEQPHVPIQPPFGNQNRVFSRRYVFGSRMSALGFVGLFLMAVVLCFSAYPKSLFQENGFGDNRLRDENDDDGKPSTFVFDLFPKSGMPAKLGNDVELKLGRFVEVNTDNVVSALVDDGVRASKIKAALSAVESTTILPVMGGSYPDGLYYTKILLGSPGRPYFLDIDTGSDLAWVQCDAPCTSCAKGPHPLYKPKRANIIPSKDALCAEVQQTHRSGYWHCLTADAAGAGYMFLGDDFVPQRQLEWVSMLNIPTTNAYVAEVSKISYGNTKLSLNGLDNGHVIFDSGSSYTYFTKQAYADLVTTLQSVSNDDLIQDESDSTLPLCWRAKIPIRAVSEVKQYFKPLTFQFGWKWLVSSVKMRIPPEGYLVVNNKGHICLGVLDGSEVHDGATIVLGDVSLRGQLVVYDNVNNLIGWMRSDCVKPQTSTSLPFP